MLIITARVGERIRIGDVEVHLIQVRGPQVRIGIEAPPSVKVESDRLRQARESKEKTACAAS